MFTERQINIVSMNSRPDKQGNATIDMSFEIGGKEELRQLTNKLRSIDGVLDIKRSMG